MSVWFWWFMTGACLLWYLTVTVYVAIKGAADIKQMLKTLSEKGVDNSQEQNKE